MQQQYEAALQNGQLVIDTLDKIITKTREKGGSVVSALTELLQEKLEKIKQHPEGAFVVKKIITRLRSKESEYLGNRMASFCLLIIDEDTLCKYVVKSDFNNQNIQIGSGDHLSRDIKNALEGFSGVNISFQRLNEIIDSINKKNITTTTSNITSTSTPQPLNTASLSTNTRSRGPKRSIEEEDDSKYDRKSPATKKQKKDSQNSEDEFELIRRKKDDTGIDKHDVEMNSSFYNDSDETSSDSKDEPVHMLLTKNFSAPATSSRKISTCPPAPPRSSDEESEKIFNQYFSQILRRAPKDGKVEKERNQFKQYEKLLPAFTLVVLSALDKISSGTNFLKKSIICLESIEKNEKSLLELLEKKIALVSIFSRSGDNLPKMVEALCEYKDDILNMPDDIRYKFNKEMNQAGIHLKTKIIEFFSRVIESTTPQVLPPRPSQEPVGCHVDYDSGESLSDEEESSRESPSEKSPLTTFSPSGSTMKIVASQQSTSKQ